MSKKKIVFVDDEQDVLDGLRDALRPMRREWAMRFANGGAAALELLAEEPADVIVSDMRMPGMDGATLLTAVRDDHPDTVRMVLSGYAEATAAVRAAAVAHVILGKPCPAETLRAAIERALGLREVLGETEIRRVATGAAALPPAPAVYQRLVDALGSSGASPEELAAIVSQDIAISAKVLQLANSAFFGRRREVSTIEDAVVDLGTETIKALILTSGLYDEFPAPPQLATALEDLRAHSLLTAAIAREIADGTAHAQDAFTGGLLHDIGLLVIGAQETEYLTSVLETARREGRPVVDVELEQRDISHAEVGAHLLALWGIPQDVLAAVAHHHRPERALCNGFDAVIAVHVADVLAQAEGSDVPAPALDEALLERLGLADRLPAWRRIAAEHRDVDAAV